MLDRIISASLSNRFAVVAIAVALAVYGTIVAFRLPIDVLPDLNRPTVTILTEAHGLVPEDVERRVTRPIEFAVNGAAGVVRTRSSSGMGLSLVTVEFDWGTDVYENRQVVNEKLQLARRQLPIWALPQLGPISSIMGQVQIVALRSTSGATEPSAIRALADQRVKLALLAVPGVAQVFAVGGAARQLQVHVDAEALRAFDVDLADIAEAVRASNVAGSGGLLQRGSKGTLIQVTGLVETELDLARAVVRDDPVRPVRIGDVARVAFGPAAVRMGDAGVNGGAGALVVVLKQPGVDTMALTERIDAELARIASSLPDDIEILPGIYRQADFIERAVENVVDAVRDGSILVVLVLVLFLLNFRTTFITLTAIPMSLAVTAVVFHWFGLSINTMTLGGLAVAIGALVDDAIVDVENVFRRLRQNVAAGNPVAALRVVFRASSEVRRPIVLGTLVVAAVYVPLFFLSGMEGRLFAPIGIAYIVSILASLTVALTLTPALCFLLLPQSRAVAGGGPDSWTVVRLKAFSGRVIDFGLRFPVAIPAILGALVVLAIATLAARGTEFLPAFNEGTAQVNLNLPPGTSLERAAAYGQRLETVVLGVDGVRAVGRRTGRADDDEHAMGVEINEMIVSFDPESEHSRDELLAEIRERVEEEFPGVPMETEQPLAHLLSHMLSGVTAQVAIKIVGDDLIELRRLADRVRGVVGSVYGVTDLNIEPLVLVEQIRVNPNRDALARFGLTVENVTQTVELALEGERISTLQRGEFGYPIVMRLAEQYRTDLHVLRALTLSGPSGRRVRLGDVAEVVVERGANEVRRENARRRIVVSHNVQGRALGDVVADVDGALASVRERLPPGYSIRLGGQFESQQSASRVIASLSLLSLAVMIGLVFSHFRSINLTLQTLLNVPMAFIGAVVFIVATNQNVSIATLVGLISLGGIAARNKILLLDHYLHLMAEEEQECSRELVRRAGQERIVPVLMTALTSGIALMPLVLSPGEPGRELLYPVASVIVGGLIVTTVLDVLLTPTVFWHFGRDAAVRVAAQRRAGRERSASIAS